MPSAFIEAKDLRKTYHIGKIEVEALRGISFSVQKGEFVSIVGPSGSGKSTLFYLLGGLTKANGGSVVLDGDDLATLSDAERTRMRKRKIGFVFQKFNLLPTLDARSNIMIAQEISGNGNFDARSFRPHHRPARPDQTPPHRPAELSGGEQQRVALARALINKPAVSSCRRAHGEPRLKNSDIVLGMLRQSNQELGQTVLMITHNPEAAKFGDRIIHMRDGESSAQRMIRSGLLGKNEPEIVSFGSLIAEPSFYGTILKTAPRLFAPGFSRAVKETVLEDQAAYGIGAVVWRCPKIMQKDERPGPPPDCWRL